MIFSNPITIIILSIACSCVGQQAINNGGLTFLDKITEIENKIEKMSKENADLKQSEILMKNEIRKLESKLMSEYQ